MSLIERENPLPSPEASPPEVAEALGRGFALLRARIVQYGLLFVSGLLVARLLGPAGRGQYAVVLSLALLVYIFGHLSLDASVGRLLAHREATFQQLARVLAAATIFLGVPMAGLTFAIGAVGSTAVFQRAGTGLLALAALTVPFLIASLYANGLLARIGRLRVIGWAGAASAACQLLAVAIFAAVDGLTPERAMAAFLVGSVVLAAIPVFDVARHAGRRALVPAGDRAAMARVLRVGLALHPSTLAIFANMRLDIFLVSALLSARETGLYSLAVTLAELVFLFSGSVAVSAMQAQTFSETRRAAEYTVEFGRQSFSVAVAIAVAVSVASYPFVVFVYGSEWRGAVAPLAILSVAAVALVMEGSARILLIRVASARTVSVLAVVAAAINVGMNAALIPVIGILGAAIGSVVSYWALLALTLAVIRQRTGLATSSMFRPRSDDLVLRTVSRWIRPRHER